jgi:hypothetical protein
VWVVELIEAPGQHSRLSYPRWHAVALELDEWLALELADLVESDLPEHAGRRFRARVVELSVLSPERRARVVNDLGSGEFVEYAGRLRGILELERAIAS